MFYVIGFTVLGIWLICLAIPRIQYRRRMKTPMYLEYVGRGNNYRPRLSTDESQGIKSPLCPICRMYFSAWQRASAGNIEDIFCNECNKKIRARGENFHPTYIKSHRDWAYLKYHKDSIFWIINGDYELGLIDADEASQLMHDRVPKNFGTIPPIAYRGWHYYIEEHHSNMGSSYSDCQCMVCFKVDGCRCKQLYCEAIRLKKWPKALNLYLSQLSDLQPKFVITGYRRESGKTSAITEARSEFKVEDYFTYDDWQSIKWIMNFSTNTTGEYTEKTIQNALNRYIQMIIEDWKVLLELHTAINRGEHPQIPILPHTDPDSIKEIRMVPKSKTTQQRLEEKYLN